MLGADHPDTLTSRNNLAGAHRAAGDLGRAIPMYEQVLADRLRVLSADHPDTLTSRNSLAGAYQTAGRMAEAIPLYEQVLADRERVLGADHPLTKIVHANLAAARQHPQYRPARRPEARSQRSELIPPSVVRVVNRTINDMIIYGRPDQADVARRLS